MATIQNNNRYVDEVKWTPWYPVQKVDYINNISISVSDELYAFENNKNNKMNFIINGCTLYARYIIV